MMFFGKKSPAPDAARHQPPRGEMRTAGRVAPGSNQIGKLQTHGGAAVEPTCALWHDIARALEAKPKGAK